MTVKTLVELVKHDRELAAVVFALLKQDVLVLQLEQQLADVIKQLREIDETSHLSNTPLALS
jgi:hypothetical protein